MPQRRNAELVDLLSGSFQRRNEPNFSLANVISTMSMLPGLRGLWPMSSSSATLAYDFAPTSQNLTITGSPAYSTSGLVPYYHFPALGDYLYRTSETLIQITADLTVGGWIYPTAKPAAGNVAGIFDKWNATSGGRSWSVRYTENAALRLMLSSDGTAESTAITTSNDVAPVNTWTFFAARYTPGNTVMIATNKTVTSSATAVAALRNNTSVNVRIGEETSANHFVGGGTLFFLCAASVSDSILRNVYEQTRGLFGV